MAIENNQLFLDRFIEVNVERYKDNPALVTMFQNLTLGQIIFSNYRETVLESGQVAHLYDMEVPGVFIARNQMYYPAEYEVHHVTTITKKEVPVEDLNKQGEQGVYTDVSGNGVAVVLKGDLDVPTIKALIKDKCAYNISDDEITVNQALDTVTIRTHTVLGVLSVVESLYDGIQRYNGQFRYNGDIKYL